MRTIAGPERLYALGKSLSSALLDLEIEPASDNE